MIGLDWIWIQSGFSRNFSRLIQTYTCLKMHSAFAKDSEERGEQTTGVFMQKCINLRFSSLLSAKRTNWNVWCEEERDRPSIIMRGNYLDWFILLLCDKLSIFPGNNQVWQGREDEERRRINIFININFLGMGLKFHFTQHPIWN